MFISWPNMTAAYMQYEMCHSFNILYGLLNHDYKITCMQAEIMNCRTFLHTNYWSKLYNICTTCLCTMNLISSHYDEQRYSYHIFRCMLCIHPYLFNFIHSFNLHCRNVTAVWHGKCLIIHVPKYSSWVTVKRHYICAVERFYIQNFDYRLL